MSNTFFRRRVKSALFFLFIAAALVLLGTLMQGLDSWFANNRFEKLTDQIFRTELAASSLDLHYTLADPAKQGIKEYTISFGSPGAKSDPSLSAAYEQAINDFPAAHLNTRNRRLQKVIRYYVDAEKELGDAALCQEPLSPSLGIQAQLPVLLAEYTFRTKQDISDYLGLLKSLPSYFKELILLEQKKAENNLFMNDAAADGIIKQCSAFITNPEDNYLDGIFEEKIRDLEFITDKERSEFLALHSKLLQTSVIPAYQSLIDALTELKGKGKNPYGLCYLSGGKTYYQYLLKTAVGTSDSPEKIRRRLLDQLLSDTKEMRALLKKNPDLKLTPPKELNASEDPMQSLTILEKKIQDSFPTLKNIDYDVKYVHKDLAPYLSPAFYLTPPIDTNSPNAIYINPASNLEGIDLFTTLAHEGFPGHLYQTVYFSRTNPPMLRHLFSPAGYIEGWATYIESYAFSYSDGSNEETRLLWLNRSINLCLYSLLDIGIHYYGWTPTDTLRFLSSFGISDRDTINRIYQYILETPSNYLKYYLGYLNFLDLKNYEQKNNPDFNLKAFHKEVLEIGPLPFEILKEELRDTAAVKNTAADIPQFLFYDR